MEIEGSSVQPYKPLYWITLQGLADGGQILALVRVAEDQASRRTDRCSPVLPKYSTALFPVLALREFRVGAVQLGILFTSLAAGSVFGAVLVVPKMRMNLSSNAITILSSALLVAYYYLAGHVRHALLFTLLAPIGGIAWTVAASELWLVEQRLTSRETRGRANAVYMVLSNAGRLYPFRRGIWKILYSCLVIRMGPGNLLSADWPKVSLS